MKNKFKMELTWHNCENYPPSELYNNRLIMTDGKYVFDAMYHKECGWKRISNDLFIPRQQLTNYWWADLEQTVRSCSEFKEDESND